MASLYKTGRDFGVDSSVLQELSSFANNALTLDNAITIYDQRAKIVEENKQDPSESLCLNVVPLVQVHAFYVVNTSAFLQISLRGLFALLVDSNLFIKEKDLYFAVMRWIEADFSPPTFRVSS